MKKIILVILIFIALERLTRWKTEGFRVYKMTSNLSYDPRWKTGILSQEEHEKIEAVLDQSFHFLGSGTHFYVFESQDGKTVIKFIKHHRKRPVTWINHVKFPIFDQWRQQIIRKREKNLADLMYSCKMAYEDLKEETGLIYAHLNKTPEWHKKLNLTDSLGIAHTIDLDSTEFLLQKKATLFSQTFVTHAHNRKKYVESLIHLVSSHCRKGIANLDLILHRNLGIYEGKVLAIDFGSLAKKPSLKTVSGFKREVFFETLLVRKWIQDKHPELLNEFDEELKALLSTKNKLNST